ncbi:DUF6415 family natural product biosynthesis protein [Streptomyces sp. KLMMK]|uniref:DUF6415 family natural product biosynthesis protein n=1 Tax=Streptomyces sp. KLMMK TaxID=3109353 RepID=UPI0030086DC1
MACRSAGRGEQAPRRCPAPTEPPPAWVVIRRGAVGDHILKQTETSRSTAAAQATTGRPIAPTEYDEIRHAIRQGLSCLAPVSDYETLMTLESELADFLERRLMPIVRAQLPGLDPESMGWSLRQSALERARQALEKGPGDGLHSAAGYVCDLARVSQVLLDDACVSQQATADRRAR